MYSVIDASSLYGTPFFRRYPSRNRVVTTLSDPPSVMAPVGGGPPRKPLPPPPGTVGLIGVGAGPAPRPRCGPCHSATEKPCHVFSAGGCLVRSKLSSRVCVPASVSIFSVASSCHVIRSRPGCRMIPPTPNALHCRPAALSFSRSHASVARLPSPLIGTLCASPFGG